MKLLKLFLLLIVILVSVLPAQEPRVSWKRSTELKKVIELLHSSQVVNFPTTTTIRKGEFEYEIAHRFIPSLSADKAFLGIDGPANIRMALAYGISDNMLVTLARSSLEDNIDLRLKYRIWEKAGDVMPVAVAIRAGAAWNTEINTFLAGGRETSDPKNFQYYGQLVLNTLLWKKLGLGLVPSYLYNSHIYCKDTEYSFTTGSYIQYYAGAMWSLYVEGNTTVTGFRGQYNSLHFGIELETGGHFFKIFVGNNAALNPSQYLAGSDKITSLKNLRLGFNITRILKF